MGIYDKILAVFGILRTQIDRKTDMLSIAGKFVPTRAYTYDEVVVHDNNLYKCTELNFKVSTKAKQSSVADGYESSKTYSVNDLAIKSGVLQRCTSAGSGQSASFTITNIADEINALRSQIAQLASSVSSLSNNVSRARVAGDILGESVEKLMGKVDAIDDGMKRSRAPVAAGNIDMSVIAPEWRPGVDYRPGLSVLYDGKLYCCAEKHKSGDLFDKSMWSESTIADIIDGMASAFSDTIKEEIKKKE